jgi:hypothetical protein
MEPITSSGAAPAIVPRLCIGFRGRLLAAVIQGDRVVCQVQDFYEAHFKDFWILEHALEDGALLGAVLAQSSHDHVGHQGPFAVAGDVVLSPIRRTLDAWRLSTGAPLRVPGVVERLRQSVDYRAGLRDMRVGLLVDDGARALVQERDETLGVWDLEAGRRAGELRERMGPIQCAVPHPDGERLAIATSSRLRLWDLKRGAAERSVGVVTGRTTSLAFRPDGGAVVACNARGLVTTWDLARGGRPVRREMLTSAAVYDAEGDRCAAVALEADPTAPPSPPEEAPGVHTLHVWDTRTEGALLKHRLPGFHASWEGLAGVPRVVGFLPAGRLVVQGSKTLTVFEPHVGELPGAAPAPWYPDDYDGDSPRGLPFGGYGPPVATWRAGQPGWQRVPTIAFRAVLRPKETGPAMKG